MDKIIECVPNFSEGRNTEVINQITSAITSVDGVRLLDVDPGKDTNRTVVTFVGYPEYVIEAAFNAIKEASLLIGMAFHKGAHPRMGATDVCPLIPVSGISNKECVRYAEILAKRVGEELGIPVYLYGNAATRPERVKLPDIREGEYEALPEKLKKPEFEPDFGPTLFNPSTGATAIGVRDFMLAYNVNLNTRDTKLAREIALNIRESGRAKRDENGTILRDENGKAIKVPGKLKFCQAAGWYIDEYGYTQVTMNLHNFRVTGLHTAFETVCDEATRLGLRVTGSELVGLLPKQALIDAGEYYLRKQGKAVGVPEESLIHTAILSLGLNDTTPFNPDEKIVEYAIREKGTKLVDRSVEKFTHELSSDSPAPGGGSISALSGALSAGLSSMVANLTFGKAGYQQHDEVMEDLAVKAQSLKRQYLSLVDNDTDAFNAFMSAVRMPKKTSEDKKLRNKTMKDAAKAMTKVPFETLKLAVSLLELSETAVTKGNANALSDAAVGAIQAEAAAEGAWLNVMINLPSINDKRFVEKYKKESDILIDTVKKTKRRIVTFAKRRLR